jgi:hypothetical protein
VVFMIKEVIKVEGLNRILRNFWTQSVVRAIGGRMVTVDDIQASVETDALCLPIRLRRRCVRAQIAWM